ncbi:four helix bundle protein [bacterium]|nr:four helix bundle protein [bacterium]
MHQFEKIEVWKRSCSLAVEIYEALKDCRDYAYKDQMLRSSLSIPSNIAEGSERHSSPDFIRFLRYSKGSSAELRTQVYIAAKVGILTLDQAQSIASETIEISKILEGFIQSLKAI